MIFYTADSPPPRTATGADLLLATLATGVGMAEDLPTLAVWWQAPDVQDLIRSLDSGRQRQVIAAKDARKAIFGNR